MAPLRKFVFTGFLLAAIGWGGLYMLFNYTLPTLGPRWLFFFLLMLGLSGAALPIVAFLNRRFPGETPTEGSTILRQSMWVGIFGSIVVWLNMGSVLNPTLATFLAAGFVVIEFLLRLRERARWEPEDTGDE